MQETPKVIRDKHMHRDMNANTLWMRCRPMNLGRSFQRVLFHTMKLTPNSERPSPDKFIISLVSENTPQFPVPIDPVFTIQKKNTFEENKLIIS